MVTVCLQCGDEGAANALVYCVNCLDSAVHRYCLDELPQTFHEFVHWVCDDCDVVVPQKVTSTEYVHSERKDCTCTSSKYVESNCRKKLLKGDTTKLVLDSTEAMLNDSARPVTECALSRSKKMINHAAATLHVTKQLPQSTSWQRLVDTNMEAGSVDAASTGNEVSPENSLEKKGSRKNLLSQNDKQRLKSHSCGKTYKEKDSNDLTECHKLLCDSDLSSGVEQREAFGSIAKLNDQCRPHDPNTDLKEIDRVCNALPSNKLKTKKRSFDCSGSMANQEDRCRQHGASKDLEKVDRMHNILPSEDNIKGRNFDSSLTDLSEPGLEQLEAHSFPLSKAPLNPAVECYKVAQPVIDPIWMGSFNIPNSTESDEMDRLVIAHLSKKVGKQVYDEARLFPSALELELHPKADVWPKRFQELRPSDDDIAIYFFPMSESYEGVFDQLVEEMMDHELALKAITENAELLDSKGNIFSGEFLEESKLILLNLRVQLRKLNIQCDS